MKRALKLITPLSVICIIDLLAAIYCVIMTGGIAFGILRSLFIILPLAAFAFLLNDLINKLVENRKV
jgi:hypothetical protein